jgi:hypothetical protein
MFDDLHLMILLSSTRAEEKGSPFYSFFDVVPLHLGFKDLKKPPDILNKENKQEAPR